MLGHETAAVTAKAHHLTHTFVSRSPDKRKVTLRPTPQMPGVCLPWCAKAAQEKQLAKIEKATAPHQQAQYGAVLMK